jgi:hypothetical protein
MLLLSLPGCADTASFSAQQQRVIRDADPDAVLTAAAIILKREFGRARVDGATRQIMTSPVEFTTRQDSGTARDLYGAPTTMRRTAVFSVVERGESALVRLRIEVERQDTIRQAVMQPRSHRLSDAPGHQTPIDEDAATTHQQNTVWTRVRRDTKLERALLDELREQFEPRPIEPQSPPEPPAPSEPAETPEP